MKKAQQLELLVIKGNVLGVSVFRGYAKLSDLAHISKADIYDKQNNPHGTQRDLSPVHAQEAYEYVKTHEIAFWQEVFLCARQSAKLKFSPFELKQDFGTLIIDLEDLESSNSISRVDGNQRLHYADGTDPKFPAIEKTVSFCLAHNLTLEQDITLFKDINDNQKAMNTSHLDNIEIRLTPEQLLKAQSPDLYIAKKPSEDSKSPLIDRVYDGGKRVSGADLQFRALRSGIKYLFSKSTPLPLLVEVDSQYKVVRNYFVAVSKWQPRAWTNPREYIVLRGAGLWAICMIGANVIDKTLIEEKFDANSMLETLKSGKDWNWSGAGDFKGYSGVAGANEISKKVIQHFQRKKSDQFFKKIMDAD